LKDLARFRDSRAGRRRPESMSRKCHASKKGRQKKPDDMLKTGESVESGNIGSNAGGEEEEENGRRETLFSRDSSKLSGIRGSRCRETKRRSRGVGCRATVVSIQEFSEPSTDLGG